MDLPHLAWKVSDENSSPDGQNLSLDKERRAYEMRGNGASWEEIGRELDLTRQQARYAYQRALRAERRKAKRT